MFSKKDKLHDKSTTNLNKETRAGQNYQSRVTDSLQYGHKFMGFLHQRSFVALDIN